MNIMQKVTLRQMREAKTRTLVTIIGAALSMAMITAVTIIVLSFLDLFAREEIARAGDWQFSFSGSGQAGYEAVLNDPSVEAATVEASLGYALFSESNDVDRPYFYLTACNSGRFARMPLSIVKGRLPEKEGELLLPSTLSGLFDLGDVMDLALGDRVMQLDDGEQMVVERNYLEQGETFSPRKEAAPYTVVGVYDDSYARGGCFYQLYTAAENETLFTEKATVYVTLKKLVPDLFFLPGEGFFGSAQRLCAQAGGQQLNYHTRLLMWHGLVADSGLNRTLSSAVLIVGFIILVGSVSLIYNAFSISLSERTKALGMLASVGATKRQKRASVLFEGAAVGAVAIPLGALAGFVGMAVTFHFVRGFITNVFGTDQALVLRFSLPGLLISAAAAALILLLSAAIPARKAGRVGPIDAIRQTGEVKLRPKSLSTRPFVRLIFGFEGELAAKNMKRSRKRYLATLFSLTVSVMLFLTAVGFSDVIRRSFGMTTLDLEYDLNSYISFETQDQLDAAVPQLASTPYAARTVSDISTSLPLKRREGLYTPELIKALERASNGEIEGVEADLVLHGLDDDSFAHYARSYGLDPQAFYGQEMVSGILVNQRDLRQESTFSQLHLLNVSRGDRLELGSYLSGVSDGGQVELGAVVDESPDLLVGMDYYPQVHLFVPVSEASHLLYAQHPLNQCLTVEHYYFGVQDDKALEQSLRALFPHLEGRTSSYINNWVADRRGEQQTVALFEIFFYGFVALIALVSIANVFNTISTGVLMRTQELAMLRSVGMTGHGVDRMLFLESFFYGAKSLLYGGVLGVLSHFAIYRALQANFAFSFEVPLWGPLTALAAMAAVVAFTTGYAVRKARRGTIVTALKQEVW